MGNGTEEAPSSPPGASASSTGSVQPPPAQPQPQPLQGATVSPLPAGLGLGLLAREQMRQVEGERDQGAILGPAPTVTELR